MLEGPRRFQAVAIKRAMKLYLDTGLKANTAYTPKNMLATAGNITGKTYKRGQMEQAIADLEKELAENA